VYQDYLLEQDGGRLIDNNEAFKNIFGLGELPRYKSTWADVSGLFLHPLLQPARVVHAQVLTATITPRSASTYSSIQFFGSPR
jgi:hypothetical protein